jgi:isoleucyl-tRNA synthetase
MEKAGITDYELVGDFTGADCEYMKTRHPLYDRVSLVIVGDHVTLDSGTGCVHTAPGFGADDFIVCQKYPEIPMLVPVDADGRQTEETGKYAGMKTAESNGPILEDLRACGALLATEDIVHQYPHCWRCKEPVMFRATKQWFCSVDAIKEDAVKAINDVQWIPQWGQDRITSMVRDRNDWCISRQRRWGVPIPVLYCEDCGKPIVNETTIEAIAEMFRKEGSDSWYIHTPEYFLPEGFACPDCGCKKFTQEQDILDVWFDSGTTHFGVLKQRENLAWPADLYLEGADQYRGWFQSSLLTAVACGLPAPYKAVCTHGWVVDGEGRQMHKSAGNAISPSEVIDQYGADIFRLWVASSDYHSDIRVSKEIIKQLAEAYRKIRNTARYILGNLDGFNPDTDRVSADQLTELDKWTYGRLDEVIAAATAGYEALDFHVAFHTVLNFCTVDMSSFYLDVIKDRLYCEGRDSVLRRAAQTTIYDVLTTVDRLIAPILVFTSEEIWQHIPKSASLNMDSVFYNDMPAAFGITVADPAKWETLEKVRSDVQKAMEQKRAAKVFGKSLEAKVTLYCTGELYDLLSSTEDQLADILIASQVAVVNGEGGETTGEVEGLSVTAERAEGEKCERCWKVLPTIGADAEHPTLCPRCAAAVKSLL